MLNKEKIEALQPLQILGLDMALDTFNCRGISCDICPMYFADKLKIDEHKITSCLCVYIAARALKIKTTL